MSKRIVPREFKTHLITQMVESISEPANTTYYSFIGDHVASGVTEDDVVAPSRSGQDLNIDTYRNMIFGKRLNQSDMRVMIPRYDWQAGNTYVSFDDDDPDLYDKPFYVVVDESSYKHVYKCLYNANNAASTIQPTFGDVVYDAALYTTGDDYYETSDGYQWKYMYSIDSLTFSNFATQNFIPVVANTVVEANAVDGSLDVILVENGGKNYNNFVSGQFTLSDVKVQSNTFLYKLPDGSGTADGFYGNTIIHLLSGTGAGQWSRITDSFLLEGVGVIVQVANTFTITPDSSTRYELSPEIKIVSDGTQSSNAIARALINNAASNSIYKVEILDVGENYNYATAEVLTGGPAAANGGPAGSAGDIVVPTASTIRPIIPPPGGHGANSAIELGGKALGIYTLFNKDEDGTVEATNTFGQFGIIRDPVFANVEVHFVKASDDSDGSDGEFSLNETVVQFKKIRLYSQVTTIGGNVTITANLAGTAYDEYIKTGDYIYLNDTIGNYHHISEVNSASAEDTITLFDAPPWTSSTTDVYIANRICISKIRQKIGSNSFYLDAVKGKLEIGEYMIGLSSGAVAKPSGIDINERYATANSQYNFSTFNQMTRCVGAVSSGTFLANEIVYQGSSVENSSATAYVHSANSTHLTLTRVSGNISTGVNIIGDESSAILSAPFTKYNGDLDPTSGAIVFLQNDVPVSRDSNQSEEIRVILEF